MVRAETLGSPHLRVCHSWDAVLESDCHQGIQSHQVCRVTADPYSLKSGSEGCLFDVNECMHLVLSVECWLMCAGSRGPCLACPRFRATDPPTRSIAQAACSNRW